MNAIVAEACLILLAQRDHNFRYFCTLAGNAKGGCLLAQRSGRENLWSSSSLSPAVHQEKGQLWLPRALKVQYECTNKTALYFFFSTANLQEEGSTHHVGLLISFFFCDPKMTCQILFTFSFTLTFLLADTSKDRKERECDSAQFIWHFACMLRHWKLWLRTSATVIYSLYLSCTLVLNCIWNITLLLP